MQFPKVLVSFRKLRGTYGRMTVTAKSAQVAELRLTDEFLELTRADATALMRALTDWLAGTATETTVVRTHGATSEVVVVDDGPGQPGVTVVDTEPQRPREPPTFERVPGEYQQVPPRRPT